MQNIERYLMSCRELTAFCSHNGWIDKNSLYYEVIEQNDHYLIAFVQFEEILMEGSGCIAGRMPCEGRLHLTLDRYGQVSQAKLL
jgi:hypothetical protein